MFNEIPEGMGPRPFVHKRIIGAVSGFVTGGPAGALAGAFRGGGSGSSAFTGSDPGQGLGRPSSSPCRWPARRDPNTGRCEAFLGSQPGLDLGRPGTGEAVAGGFNMPAFVPDVVGSINRNDGSSGPILRCPRGTVLATDDLCYAKGTKGLAAHRKWKKGPAPFLSGSDRKCLLRANTLRRSKTSKRILRELGMG